MTSPLRDLASPARFRQALSFLTRLHPPVMAEAGDLAASSIFFPLVGALLGALVVLPFKWGLLHGQPWAQAWLAVLLSCWLTRGLHWDGIADICDAMGGSYDAEGFWRIIKDSRMGAFGTMALVLGLGGQLVLVHAMCVEQSFDVLIWSLALGRLSILLLGRPAIPLARPGLGREFILGMTDSMRAVALAFTLLLGLFCLPLLPLLAGLALACFCLFFLWRIGIRYQGMNGDFLGAAVITGELSGLVGWLVFQ